MTSTGRHLDETQAGISNAPSERADLYGQSYCERHQGQQPKGRTQRPDKRTQSINSLRGHLSELGIIAARGSYGRTAPV